MIDLPGQIKDVGTTEIFENDDIPSHQRPYFMGDNSTDDSGYSESRQQTEPHDKRSTHSILHRTVESKEISWPWGITY